MTPRNGARRGAGRGERTYFDSEHRVVIKVFARAIENLSDESLVAGVRDVELVKKETDQPRTSPRSCMDLSHGCEQGGRGDGPSS